MMIRRWEHSEKSVADGQTYWTIQRAAWYVFVFHRNCMKQMPLFVIYNVARSKRLPNQFKWKGGLCYVSRRQCSPTIHGWLIIRIHIISFPYLSTRATKKICLKQEGFPTNVISQIPRVKLAHAGYTSVKPLWKKMFSNGNNFGSGLHQINDVNNQLTSDYTISGIYNNIGLTVNNDFLITSDAICLNLASWVKSFSKRLSSDQVIIMRRKQCPML